MVDLFAARRSWLMSVLDHGYRPLNLVVRRMVWHLGIRYRLHVASLPGKPDLVISRLRQIIDVRGCFWHRHGCKLTTNPKSNRRFGTRNSGDGRRDARNATS